MFDALSADEVVLQSGGNVRRSGWVTLLAASGVVLGGAYVIRRHRRKRADRRLEAVDTPHPQPAAVTHPDDPGVPGPRVRPAFLLALFLVSAVAAVMVIRLSTTDPITSPNRGPEAESPAARPIVVAPIRRVTALPVPTRTPAPVATVEPDSLASDGVSCDADTAPPVLNTVHPVLTARMTATGPADVEIKERDADRFVSVNAGDLMPRDGLVTLYFRGYSRLEPGKSYRWRIRATPANDWSRWCEFSIAAATVDTLNLDADRLLTAGLPPSRWRDIAGVLGPGGEHGNTPWYRSIQAAGGLVSAGDVPVTFVGWYWIPAALTTQTSAFQPLRTPRRPGERHATRPAGGPVR